MADIIRHRALGIDTRESPASIISTMGLVSNMTPNAPALSLDFLQKSILDPRVTFTRASSGSYTDSAGVLKYTPVNLLTYSEQFDNAAWIKSNSSVSGGSINATTAPDGTLTADKLVENTANTQHAILQSATTAASTSVTTSVYAKAGERTYMMLINTDSTFTNHAAVIFNLSAGTAGAVVTVGAPTATSASIQSVGNGWYRCSVTSTVAATSRYLAAYTHNGSTSSYAGDGSSGIYLWGAQLEAGSSATTYIPTTTSASGPPRFDYDPVTLLPKGLLIEESRVNSIRNNTMVGAVAGTPGTLPTNWSFSTYSGMTTSVIGTETENGITYIDVRLNGTASAASHSLNFDVVGGIAGLTAQTWTTSNYVRIVGGSTANVTAIRNALVEFTAASAYVTAQVATITPTTAALNTQRYASTFTTNGGATTAFLVPGLNLTYTNGAAIDITLRIGMPQLELGAFATSVIATSTASATRAADVAVMSGTNFSSWYNQSEGTVVCKAGSYTNITTGFPTLFEISDNTATNRIVSAVNAAADVMNNEVVVSGSTVFGYYPAYTSGIKTLAFAYKTNDTAASLDGGTASTDTSCAIPVVSRMDIGHLRSANIQLNGHISRITYYPTRLTNAQLKALSA